MWYLKFRNISLLKMQEIDVHLIYIYELHPQKLFRIWNLADTSHGGWDRQQQVKGGT
jgi:hypothetical protein